MNLVVHRNFWLCSTAFRECSRDHIISISVTTWKQPGSDGHWNDQLLSIKSGIKRHRVDVNAPLTRAIRQEKHTKTAEGNRVSLRLMKTPSSSLLPCARDGRIANGAGHVSGMCM